LHYSFPLFHNRKRCVTGFDGDLVVILSEIEVMEFDDIPLNVELYITKGIAVDLPPKGIPLANLVDRAG
jgi:hypothetical protein